MMTPMMEWVQLIVGPRFENTKSRSQSAYPKKTTEVAGWPCRESSTSAPAWTAESIKTSQPLKFGVRVISQNNGSIQTTRAGLAECMGLRLCA